MKTGKILELRKSNKIMNANNEISGIMVPLVTPLDNNGELASEKARALIEKDNEVGVDGFYVGGSSGDGFLQLVAERCDYMRLVTSVAVLPAPTRCCKPRLASVYSNASWRRCLSTARNKS